MIKEIRECLGFSQTTMGRFMGGYRQHSVSNWERNKTPESYSPKLLRVLDDLLRAKERTITDFLKPVKDKQKESARFLLEVALEKSPDGTSIINLAKTFTELVKQGNPDDNNNSNQ